MGFDLFGVEPLNEKGEYFRNNMWHWPPLWDYVQKETGILTDEEYDGGLRHDGYVISGEKAQAIAEKLNELIESGKTEEFIQARSETIDALPDEVCEWCDGKGLRHPGHLLGKGPCLACNGTGKKRPLISNYAMDLENVKDFIEFCRFSGGFQIC